MLTTANTTTAHAALPHWAALLLATTTGALGLAISAVTADFFVLGLQQIETDAIARQALAAAGILMIAAEVVAFFIAALLPAGHRLRPLLLWAGFALIAFEALTLFATQHALVQSAAATHSGQQARIAQLQTSIAQAQASAAGMSGTAQAQIASRFVQQRQDGQATMQAAQALLQSAAAQSKELQSLLAAQRPSLTDAFGHSGMVAYSAARAMLLTATGLVMMSAAGGLLRLARLARRSAIPVLPDNGLRSITLAPASSPWRSTMRLPAASIALLPMMIAVPALHTSSVPGASVPAPDQQRTASAPTRGTAPRYSAARAAILTGALTVPSVRAIQQLVGGNTSTAREIQAAMLAEGLIERAGQSYRIAQAEQAEQAALI